MRKNMPSIVYRAFRQSHPLDFALASLGYLDQLRRSNSDTVTHAAVEVTYACDGNCGHCYVPPELKTDEVIDEQLFKSVLSQMRKSGFVSGGIIGGEPLSQQTVPMLTRVASDYWFMPFALITNGKYITDYGMNGLSGLHNIAYSVSIDGFQETNDLFRGKGSYWNARNALAVLRRGRKVFGTLTTLQKDNLVEATSPAFLDMLYQSGAKFAGFIKLKTHPDKMISPEEFDEVMHQMQPFMSTHNMFLTFGGNDRGQAESEDYSFRTLYVNPRGDVRLLKVVLDQNLGNLRQQTLEEIMASAKFKDALRDMMKGRKK